MKIYLHGYSGRMGQAVQRAAEHENITVLGSERSFEALKAAIGQCDLVIDFSSHEATAPLIGLAAELGKAAVIGTTGHNESERSAILSYQERIPMVWAGNFSLGVNLLFYLAEKVARTLPLNYHPEILEMHHRMKKDAPSGTAENLVEAVLRGRSWSADTVRHGRSGITGERPDEEIGVHALRGGEVVGEHQLIFAGPGERLELKHQASDRRIFAEGSLVAARWVIDQAPGLYNMQDVLGLK